MIRRSFLKGLGSMGLVPMMDCLGLLDQELGLAHGSHAPAIPVPGVANPDRVPPSAATGDGVVMARLKQELSLIRDLGRMEEFRAIRALFSLARDERIPCRISGAGCSSIIAFLLGGSGVLPTRHGLFFERFRDPNARWAPPFIILIDKAKKDRFVELAKSRYPGLVASGAFSFLRGWSSDVLPWLAADLVRRKGKPEFDLGQIPLDDQVTFELLRSPNANIPWIGSFHFQVGREGLLRFEPTNIAELAALSALLGMNVDYGHLFQQRVGVTKCWEPVHPVVAEATADFGGLILFQEQVMMVLNRLGGIPVEDGYDFIKAAAKKKSEIVAQYQARFLESARENGVAQEAAEAIFEQLREAASYVCCKAGSVADAMVIYYGAYLKVHYPVEFNQAVRLAMA